MKDETNLYYDITPVMDLKHFAELMLVSIAEQDESYNKEIRIAFLPADYKKRIESIMYDIDGWKIKASKLFDVIEYYKDQMFWETKLSHELRKLNKSVQYNWELDSLCINYNKQEIEDVKKLYDNETLEAMNEFTSILTDYALSRDRELDRKDLIRTRNASLNKN